ncbi:diacylglycerol/polyprenol kinase family protein [Salisaeta longa]|uniref:phosphatidate cytidylyltransferase n=1 Tax=Salisaeta longa TaxID=503170 RepID=UPI0012FA7587|nr:phosphatidate cytidylyltransferase [Salisaeta longa]
MPLAMEVRRKMVHVSTALGLTALLYVLPYPVAQGTLLAAAVCAVGAEWAQTRSARVRRWVAATVGTLMRAEEQRSATERAFRLNGASAMLVGAALVACSTPLSIARAALPAALLADAAAALVGRRWGTHPWPAQDRTVEGSAAFVGTGLLVWFISAPSLLGAGAVAVAVGALVEVWPLPLNDNIRGPLAVAYAGWAVLLIH